MAITEAAIDVLTAQANKAAIPIDTKTTRFKWGKRQIHYRISVYPLCDLICGNILQLVSHRILRYRDETMGKLGGVFSGKLKLGGYTWLLKVLPKIPLQIVYNEGDDEFPCEVQILFDRNASHFMEFECLAFLKGCLVRAMMMTAQTGDPAGWV